MDRNEIHRRALRAAAKVTLSLFGLGCGASEALSTVDERTAEGAAGCAAAVGTCQGASAGSSPAGGQAGQSSGGAGVGAPGAGGAAAGGAGQGGSAAGGAGQDGAGAGGTNAGGAGAGAAGETGQGGAAGQSIAAMVCGGPTAPPASDTQVSCCLDVVGKALPPDQPSPPSLSDEQLACCQVLVTTRDQTTAPDAPLLPYEAVYRCCDFLSPLPIGPTCTPWGPPMPPEMDLALLDELAA